MLTKKDHCDYDTCVALKELGYDEYCESSFITENITVDCVDMLGDLYEADFEKGDLINRAILSNKRTPIPTLPAPNLYEAQKWLREEKKLIVLVGFDFCPITSEIVYNWVIAVNGNTVKKSSYTYDYFEEALSEGIKEAVKILKENETIHE